MERARDHSKHPSSLHSCIGGKWQDESSMVGYAFSSMSFSDIFPLYLNSGGNHLVPPVRSHQCETCILMPLNIAEVIIRNILRTHVTIWQKQFGEHDHLQVATMLVQK